MISQLELYLLLTMRNRKRAEPVLLNTGISNKEQKDFKERFVKRWAQNGMYADQLVTLTAGLSTNEIAVDEKIHIWTISRKLLVETKLWPEHLFVFEISDADRVIDQRFFSKNTSQKLNLDNLVQLEWAATPEDLERISRYHCYWEGWSTEQIYRYAINLNERELGIECVFSFCLAQKFSTFEISDKRRDELFPPSRTKNRGLTVY